MKNSNINIKHRNRSHLFWGLDKKTNEVVYISQVKHRGLDCNCRCAHCGEDFNAKLGDIKRHHFAHKSNYECVYSNEIAVYLLAKKLLAEIATITLPAVEYSFSYRCDIAKQIHDGAVGQIDYCCDPQQYPPLLLADIDNQPTRIILSFASYYTSDDFMLLQEEATNQGWNCLAIDLPHIEDESSVTLAMLKEAIKGCVGSKRWIHHLCAEAAKMKLEKNATTPPVAFPDDVKKTYECPLHRQFRDGKYFATLADCHGCPYNIALHPDCKCLVHIGVQKYMDFEVPLEERMKKVAELCSANEMRIELLKQEAEQQAAARQTSPTDYKPVTPKPKEQPQKIYSADEKLTLGYKEIEATFDPNSAEPTYDSFGTRWVQCKKCKRIVPTQICPDYGGRRNENRGYCEDCNKKRF